MLLAATGFPSLSPFLFVVVSSEPDFRFLDHFHCDSITEATGADEAQARSLFRVVKTH